MLPFSTRYLNYGLYVVGGTCQIMILGFFVYKGSRKKKLLKWYSLYVGSFYNIYIHTYYVESCNFLRYIYKIQPTYDNILIFVLKACCQYEVVPILIGYEII